MRQIRKKLFIFTVVHLSSDCKDKLNRIHRTFQSMTINHSGEALHRLSQLESYLNMKSTGDLFSSVVKLKFPRCWVNEFHPAITAFLVTWLYREGNLARSTQIFWYKNKKKSGISPVTVKE